MARRVDSNEIEIIQRRLLNIFEDLRIEPSLAYILTRGLRLVDNGLESKCWIRGADSERYTKINKIPAHRVSYELFKGKRLVHNGCHKCDKPACINPDHIFDGTDSRNHWDSVVKGRSSHTILRSKSCY